jgi:SsrA-binding protein
MATPRPAEGFKLISENRRATMRYEVDERIEVGIVLTGAEVKSLRAGKMELGDTYAMVLDGQLTLINAYIAPYKFATGARPEEKRARRLLAHRAEIDRIDGKISQRGYTLIALKAYFKGAKVKLELGLAHAKDGADRRQEIKRREGDREARAAIKRRMQH